MLCNLVNFVILLLTPTNKLNYIMKLSQLPQASARTFKSFAKNDNIKDLYDDDMLQNVQWNERALFKAMPRSANKIKKMKS